MQILAFETSKIEKVEYTPQELNEYLALTKNMCLGFSFKENDFIDDIENTVPLFMKDGNVLSWAHKSFQDFFASEFIVKSLKKEEIAERIYKSRRSGFLNIIDFLFDMDYALIRNVIFYEFLADFIKYFKVHSKLMKKCKSYSKESISILFGIKATIQVGSRTSRNVNDFILEYLKSTNELPRAIKRFPCGKYIISILLGFNYNQELLLMFGSRISSVLLDKANINVNPEVFKDFPKNKYVHFNFSHDNLLNSPIFNNPFIQLVLDAKALNLPNSLICLLDYNKCIEQLKSIKRDMKKQKVENLFMGI